MSRRIFILTWILCLICLSGCGGREHVEESETMVQEKAAVLPDGTGVDVWKPDFGGRDVYKLKNGTTLLTVEDTMGPENVYVAGRESFDDLSEAAQKSVRSFYEEQGLLYDVQSLLEKAYAEYLDCRKSQKSFDGFFAGQDVLPSASNGSMMCFITSVRIPVSGRESQEIRTCALFDRHTGDKLNVWELFSAPEKEVVRRLLALAKDADEGLPKNLEVSIEAEDLIFLPDHLEITIPQEKLPHQEYSYVIGIDYADLADIISDRAVPYAEK